VLQPGADLNLDAAVMIEFGFAAAAKIEHQVVTSIAIGLGGFDVIIFVPQVVPRFFPQSIH
jgi:hypothetical protein